MARLAKAEGVEMPITDVVAALADGRATLADAMQALLSRPLKQE